MSIKTANLYFPPQKKVNQHIFLEGDSIFLNLQLSSTFFLPRHFPLNSSGSQQCVSPALGIRKVIPQKFLEGGTVGRGGVGWLAIKTKSANFCLVFFFFALDKLILVDGMLNKFEPAFWIYLENFLNYILYPKNSWSHIFVNLLIFLGGEFLTS